MKRYLYFIAPLYFLVRAIFLANQGDFGIGFILRIILFAITLFWAYREFLK
tara:strand:+ start:7388 stop:7540 length:153 start_codon:yes stop_codon:yes gene_type:complete